MSRASGGGSSAASALQFLSSDASGQFHLQPAAVKLLTAIKGPICPVVVCGPYRTGKSTLLNLLLDTNVKSGSFAVGGTVQACTKGMWMWGEPQQVKDASGKVVCTYVFFDSEGLGSTDQHATFDTQLFSLSLLLSSLFVLNTTGTISENALEQLELVVQLTERIKVGGGNAGDKKGTGSDLKTLAAFFPSFLWVLRDFTLELRNAQGASMSSTDYLEDALRPVAVGPNSKRGAEEKNRIRQAISQVFHTRECVTLVRPVAEERDLQRVSTLGSNSLRSEFRTQIASLKSLIPQLAHPKSIDGVVLNGRAFVALAERYVSSINSGGVPTIRTAFQSVQEIQGREAMDAAWAYVEKAIAHELDNKGGDEYVLTDEQMSKLLGDIRAHALKLIREQALGSSEDIAKLEAQFVAKHLNGLFEARQQRNTHRGEKACARTISELWTESGIEAHLPAYKSYEELNRDVSGFWAKYLALTKRINIPEKIQQEIGRNFLDKQRENIFKLLFTRLAQTEEAARQAQAASEANQAAVSKLTSELASVHAEASVATKKHELELNALQKESQRSSKDLETAEKKLRSMEGHVQSDREKHAETSRQHAAQVATLEGQLHAVQAEVQRLQHEKTQLNDQLQSTSHSLSLQTSGASKATKKFESELASLRAAHEKELLRLRVVSADAENVAAAKVQASLDETESLRKQMRAAQQEIDALKANKSKASSTSNELAETNAKLKQQLKDAEATHAQLRKQLQQERAEAAAAVEAAHAAASAAADRAVSSSLSAEENPLRLPTPTKTPLVSRQSLIPSKFSASSAAAAAGAAGAGSKRKKAQVVEEEEEGEGMGDVDMGGGDAGFGESEEEDEAPPPAKPAAAAAKRAKASTAAASAPASDSGVLSLPPGGVLKDPNSMTINELKSWLTSLDISFPQKSQPKAWYIDLAYEKLGAPLEAQFPKGGKKKTKK